MPEIGICCAKCKIKSKCFFVKPYFLCYHTQRCNTTNNFLCCIVCGERRFRNYFKFNDEDIVLSNTILNDNKCLCCNTENIPFILCKT